MQYIHTGGEGGYLPEQKCNYFMIEHDSVLTLTAEDLHKRTQKTHKHVVYSSTYCNIRFNLIEFSFCLCLKCNNGKHMFSLADHQGSLSLYNTI